MSDVNVAEHQPLGDQRRSDGTQEHVGQIQLSEYALFVDRFFETLELLFLGLDLEIAATSIKQLLDLLLVK